MTSINCISFAWALAALALTSRAAENDSPAVAEFNFRAPSGKPLPEWVTGVEQEGGQFATSPGAWVVERGAPPGRGKLVITLNREKIAQDLALGMVYEYYDDSDVAVQLWDQQNRVIAVDLFWNFVARGKEAKTDTFIIPLKKYPQAVKLAIRRVSGPVRIYGVLLYPVVGELPSDPKEQAQLMQVFGDPLSPTNSLRTAISNVTQRPLADKAFIIPASPAGANGPSASIYITSPRNYGVVSRVIDFTGTKPPLTSGQHLWLVFQVGRFLFPKIEVTIEGQSWRATTAEDGDPPNGRFFAALYQVESEGHPVLQKYVERGKTTGSYPALYEIPGGVRLDRIRLQLKPD